MTNHMHHVNYRTATDQRPAPTRTATAPTVPARAGPTESPHRGHGRRWVALAAAAAGATLVAGAVVLIVDANTESTPTAPAERTVAQQLVQESIEQSLAERTATIELPGVGSPPFVGGPSAPAERTVAQQLVQESIEQSLAERTATIELPGVGSPPFVGGSQPTEYGTSQRLVQDSIEQSLAERTATIELPGVGSPPFVR